MRFWSLVRYKYGQSLRAIRFLEECGVICYAPKVSDFYLTYDQKIKDDLIFPPYLFINVNPDVVPISKVKHTPGVAGFVQTGNGITIVPDVIMAKLFSHGKYNTDMINLEMEGILTINDKNLRMSAFLAFLEKTKISLQA